MTRLFGMNNRKGAIIDMKLVRSFKVVVIVDSEALCIKYTVE